MDHADPTAAPTDRPRPLGASWWRLLGANVMGNLGDGIAIIALPWYASTLTADPRAIAAVGIASRAPWLLALLAGVLGDRVDRRRLMVGAGATKGLVLAALTAMIALGVAEVAVVVAVALAIGACEVVFDNTGQTMVPRVVPRERLERANGTMWGVEAAANQFVGPPLGGFLIAASVVWPFGVQAALMLGAVAMLTTLRGDFRPPQRADDTADAARTVRADLAEGVRWLWQHRMLRALAIALGTVNGAMAAAYAVVVLFAQEVLGLDARAFGIITTAGAAGGIVGSQVAPWLARRVPPGTTLMVTVLSSIGLVTAIAAVPVVAVFAAGSVLSAFVGVWWNVVTVSLRQRIIPDALLSRVNSAYRTLGWGMIPVGTALGGAAASVAEPLVGRDAALRAPFLVAAALMVLLVPLVARRLTTPIIRAAEVEAAPASEA